MQAKRTGYPRAAGRGDLLQDDEQGARHYVQHRGDRAGFDLQFAVQGRRLAGSLLPANLGRVPRLADAFRALRRTAGGLETVHAVAGGDRTGRLQSAALQVRLERPETGGHSLLELRLQILW